jgi:sugar phosphate isomerase/epimerase
MAALNNLEIGVMFWAGQDPLATIRELKSLGVQCGQMGVPGEVSLDGLAQAWNEALKTEPFKIVTVFCSYAGENYADIPTVQRTVGFIPPETRRERERRTRDVSDFAAAVGVRSIACHIGFVPEDREDEDYRAVREMVRRICDHAAKNDQTFCLETGQEPADVLLNFLQDVSRPNLGINFDPANMIMYGTGDPIQAVAVLAPHIRSVHAKDGEWPVKGVAGALGVEKPLGQGAVGIEQFVAKLKSLGYKGTVNVEREIEDREQRKADIRGAVELLQRVRA